MKISRLNPDLKLNGDIYIAMTQELAGIERRRLGKEVDDVSRCRERVIAAIDFMISGI